MKGSSELCAGDWVEVRSKEEILATLDERGCIDGLPFMPEMLQFCGKRFRVFKRAHKTCDTVHKTGGRRLPEAVHLDELRCDGSAHGGCQAGCLLFWKDAWLRPLPSTERGDRRLSSGGCPEETLQRCTQEGSGPALRYRCQATELPAATTLLPQWDLRQYWEDLRSGNVTAPEMVKPVLFALYDWLMNLGVGWGGAMRWLYNRVQGLRGRQPYPRADGRIPPGKPTPAGELNLQPGETVRVKNLPEILETLNQENKNRGLYFDAEEVPFCGREFTVLRRVKRIINEQTGVMMEFSSESIILAGVYCTARYSDKRLFCPRAIYPMWREVWLERVGNEAADNPLDPAPRLTEMSGCAGREGN